MLSDLFSGVVDALISYTIDELGPTEFLESWLKQEPVRWALQKSLARTYSAFARQYPEYIASLFDQSFLSNEAVPELSKLLTQTQHPDPALLAQAWGISIGASGDFAQSATKPASYFIERLEAEVRAEPALQAIDNEQALESSSDKSKQSTDLQRQLDVALKTADEYEKVILHIEGDIKDSNIIIGDNNRLTVNKYYYSGDFVSLDEYYIPPDPVFQRVRVDEFAGRDWLTAKVDVFLNDPIRKSGAFLLIGDAGVGKTSFMANLVKERRYLHLFAEQVAGQAMLQRALQSLASQLVTRYRIDPYKDRDTLNVLAGFPDFLERLVRLAASTLTAGEKIIIVCDALDEAGVFPDHFVFGLPKELPDGVYFILSQRPVNVKLPNFEPVIEKLEAQGEDNLQDIETYLHGVANRPEMVGQIRSKGYSEEFFIQTLKNKSQGIWMYLHYIIKEIEHGLRAPLDLANLPTGLAGYYAEYWDAWRTGKRGKGEQAWDDLYAPLLATLAAAQEAIAVDQLIRWAEVTAMPREVTRLLSEAWRSFITEKEVETEKIYSLYHLSFRDFITGKVKLDELPPTQANLIKELSSRTVDAHRRIVSTFEAQCNGQWEKLAEQNYPRLHLSVHIVEAKHYKILINLLTEGRERIRWAEARYQKEETYSGYLNDLTYVWDYAERERDYGLAIRCMLVENSIRSLASNIPPKLVAELTKTGLWSYARCLATIRQKSDGRGQEKTLRLIVPDLPQILYLEALDIALSIDSESDRASAVADIAPYLSRDVKLQSIKEALAAVREIGPQLLRAWILDELAPHIPDELQAQALSIALENDYESGRATSLRGLVPHLSDQLRLQALSATYEIKDDRERAFTLATIGTLLSDELKSQVIGDALSTAREIKDRSVRARTLAAIVPHLQSELKTSAIREFLFAAHEIKDEAERAYSVVSLIPYLPDELKSHALLVTREIEYETDRAHALATLAPYLPDNLKYQAIGESLVDSRKISVDPSRADVLAALAPQLPSVLKYLALKEFLMVLRSQREFSSDSFRATALATLAPYLPHGLKTHALSVARKINTESERANALADLVPYLPEKHRLQAIQECLLTARLIRDEASRASTLAVLSRYLSNELKSYTIQESLLTVSKVKNGYYRADALRAIAPHLIDEAKLQALTIALKIARDSDRARALAALIPYLSDKLKMQVLSTVHNIYPYDRASILIELAPHLSVQQNPKIVQKAVAVAQKINHRSARARTIAAFVSCFPNEIKARVIKEVIVAARELNYRDDLAQSLASLVPHMPDDLKAQVMQEFLATMQVAVVATASKVDQENIGKALVAFAPHFTDQSNSQARLIARKINDQYDRAMTLIALITTVPDELKEAAIQEALAVIHEIEPSLNITAFTALVPYLPEKLKSQTVKEFLIAAREIKRKDFRIETLSKLAPYLSEEDKIAIFQEALYQYTFSFQSMLEEWKSINFRGIEDHIMPYIKFLSKKSRNDGVQALQHLCSIILCFSKKDVVNEIIRAIQDTARWWP